MCLNVCVIDLYVRHIQMLEHVYLIHKFSTFTNFYFFSSSSLFFRCLKYQLLRFNFNSKIIVKKRFFKIKNNTKQFIGIGPFEGPFRLNRPTLFLTLSFNQPCLNFSLACITTPKARNFQID